MLMMIMMMFGIVIITIASLLNMGYDSDTLVIIFDTTIHELINTIEIVIHVTIL